MSAHSRHALAIFNKVSWFSGDPSRAIRSHSWAYLRYSSGVCIAPYPWLFSVTRVANVPTTVTVPIPACWALPRTNPGTKRNFAHHWRFWRVRAAHRLRGKNMARADDYARYGSRMCARSSEDTKCQGQGILARHGTKMARACGEATSGKARTKPEGLGHGRD